MNKQTQRELKQQRKAIWIFLCVALPVMLVLTYLLYTLAPSLVNQQWIVISIIVIFGLVAWGGVQFIMKKQTEKNAQKPKKHDPYAD